MATAQELADFPWMRRQGDEAPSTDQAAAQPQAQLTPQELADFPWLARQDQAAAAQAVPVDDSLIQSTIAAYDRTRTPLKWAEDVIKASPLSAIPRAGTEAIEVFGKRLLETPTGIAAEAARLASYPVQAAGAAEAQMVGGVQLPNLQGMSVTQVKALREQMIAQSKDLSNRQDQIINSGTPDEYSLYGFLQAKQGLDQRIKEADGIIASGKPQVGPSGSTEPLAESLSYGGRHMAPALSGFLDKYVPTSQEFENSPVGQIAKFGADGIALAGYSLLGGPVAGGVAGGLMFGNQAYDEAKARGASDDVADRASLITAVVTGSTMAVLGPVTGSLGKSFAGLTAKQGMGAIQQAFAYVGGKALAGGIEFGGLNLEQNAIAKLSGYDPNRKLDEGTWQNFWTGMVYGTVHTATADIPHIARMFKPDVTVRNRDETPAQTGEQTQVTPTTAPVTPATPTTPEAQATAAARVAATQTPEQVIAQANPAAELEKFMAQMTGQREAAPERGFVQVGGTPPVYTGPARPAPAETRLLAGPRDATALPVAATEHGAEPVPSNTPGPQTTVPVPQAPAPAGDIGARILNAYNEVRQQSASPYVYIHDVISRSGVPLDQAKQWIADHPQIQLAEGDWGAARTEAERRGLPTDTLNQAGVELAGRNRILMDASGATREVAPAAPRGETASEKKIINNLIGVNALEDTPENRAMFLRLIREPETAPVPEAPTAENPNPKPENPSAQRRAWYETDDFANIPPVARPEPEDRAVGPADVKREVNDAQEQMGMEDHLHYVANAEALPDHVKKGLTEGERGRSAQIVRDNKLGDIYVIGDRFDSLNDLRRKLIEETLPYTYRNITKVGLTHDNTDPRTGHYDLMSDRPILNTHAIISQDRPYEEASRALMEEADAHQGISRLLGPRNGPVYVQVMDQLLQQFRRLGLVDKLAQLRGYENAQHMAQAYGTPKWDTDPQQAHKFTEELAAGWSRNFRNADELMRDGPSWWQNGLRRLNNSIRQFTGLRLSDYDVQNLLIDSAAALRRPKLEDHQSMFHPIGDNAKADMRQFQMASLPPEPTATEAGERADIGTELVKGKARSLQALVGAGQEIRAGALKQALDNTHGLQERMNLLNRQPAIYDRQHDGEVMQAGKQIFNEDFRGSVHAALDYLTNDPTVGPEGHNQAVVEVTDRETDRQIEQLAQAGRADEANILRAKLDRMNEKQLERQTKLGQEVSAIRLRRKTGSSAVAEHKQNIQSIQQSATEGTEGKRQQRQRATQALGQVKETTQAAAKTLREKFIAMAQRTGFTDLLKSLPEQYTDDLVKRMRDKFADTGTEQSTEMLAPVEQVFDTFRRNIQDIIRQRAPKPAPRMQISPASTLNEIMTNYSWYGEAWARTIQDLNEHNPALAQRFADMPDYPIGEPLANKLAAEQGKSLSDLIYNHYSTVDRLNTDLARQIASQTDIHPEMAEGLATHLQRLFGDIVQKQQSQRLQSILDSVGGTSKPAQSELDRLLNHIIIGGLDSKEWLNLVAPRFGVDSYTPEQLDGLRAAGDYLARLRDYGLANTVIAQKVRTAIGDLTSLSKIDPAQRSLFDKIRYITDVYTSSLLTNPFTHIPYWQQNVMMGSFNALVQGMRVVRETGDWNVIASQIMRGLDGVRRGLREFEPTLRGGFKPAEQFAPTYVGAIHRGPLERTEFDWQKPGSWFSKYKYVRNALDAMSNLMVRGSQYAVHQALALHLAWDQGLRGQDAYDVASELVLGSKEQQAEADRLSHQYVDELNAAYPETQISEQTRTMLREQLLDQLKTTSDNPDSSLADQQSQRLLDVARRAQTVGARGALRGDVYGLWGNMARKLVELTSEHPEAKVVAPFINVPFNFVNELMSWSPIGVMRSLKDFAPEDSQFRALVSKLPGLLGGGGIRGYIEDVPGMEAKLKSGEFSEEAVRDLAWEQMTKGILGTTVGMGLAALGATMLKNPNPPWKFTYNGPSAYNAQQAEKGKGWIPHSFYLGDWAGPLKGWHSYENTPLRSVFAALGSYEDYIRYEKQDPNDLVNQEKAVTRLMGGAVSSTLGSPLQGLETLLNVLTNTTGTDAAQRQFANFLTQTAAASATVPIGGAVSRAVYRLFDPTEYEGNDTFQKAARYIPVVNHLLLAPKLNVFGEAMRASPLEKVPEYSPTGGVLGTTIGRVIDPNDPVWHYLDEHPGIKLSLPGASGNVAGIKMTPNEIYQYHLARGPALKEQIARAINDPAFRSMPVDEQNLYVHRIYEKIANRVGQAAVIRYRQEHPVTPERRAASRVGQLEAIMKEAESTRLPEE